MKTKIKSLLLAVIFTVISCITLTANATGGIPDADGDGRISISDAVAIRMYLAGQHCPTQPDAYDTDRNGIISYMDARCVEMYLAQTWSGNGTGSSSSVEDSNTSRSYNVYNAANGNYLRNYTLSPLASKNNTRGAIGTDDRVIDWTKSGTVKLMTSTNYRGSGFVVGSHTIATAAHCVYNRLNGDVYSLSEILLFDSNGNISLHATPVECHVPTIYTTQSSLDYALITVEEDLSDYACFNLGAVSNSTNVYNQSVSVTGFPSIVNGNVVNTFTAHVKYTGNGVVIGSENERLFSNADTSEGNSGGPVYVTETINGNTYYSVIAITASIGINNNNETVSSIGTRINTDIVHFYKNNPNLNW